MAVEIIQLNDGNSGCLDTLASDVFDHPIDPTKLESFLRDPRHVMMLAVQDGLVVGLASAVEYFHPDKQPQLWINEIGVSPDYQRKGIGRRLATALVEFALSRGCSYAWLGTDKENSAARACFGSVTDVEPPQEFLLFEWDFED